MKNQSKQSHHKSSRSPQLFVLGGLLILVVAILAYKEKPQAVPSASNSYLLAEVQLDRALAARQSVLAFFHSTTCEKCLVMMDTVAQVYPQYQDSIILVDINVYDEQNETLLQRVRLQYIPTLIFYDRNGQADTHIGVMEASQLSSKLTALSGEP
jgi:thiol:disulfide interchange protein